MARSHATDDELLEELEVIALELRRRLDRYVEEADDLPQADHVFNVAGLVLAEASTLVRHAERVRAEIERRVHER